MENVKVSIIVPVYKVEKYLERCLDSLMAQTLREIEIILVDDGSPDNCPAMCDSYAEKDSRITVIHKENAGAGYARNAGIERATGEYIGFVDSDDYVSENMYFELYDTAKRNGAELAVSGVRFVGGNMFKENSASEDFESERNYFDRETLFAGEDGVQEFMLGVVGSLPHEKVDSRYGTSVWKNIFRRDTVTKNSIRFMSEREILSEDTLFILDFLRYTDRIVGVPRAYYSYCRNEGSVSKTYKRENIEKVMIFINEVAKRLSECIDKSRCKPYLDRLTQAYGRVLCSQAVMYADECGVPYRELRGMLREICERPEIAGSLKGYPWYRLPPMQAVFAFLIKYRLYALQILTVRLRGA